MQALVRVWIAATLSLPVLAVPASTHAQSLFDQPFGSAKPAYTSSRPFAPTVRLVSPGSGYSLPGRPIHLPLTFTPDRRSWSPYREQAGGEDGGRFRTVCVRICDGYYWPISFGATPGQFYRDEAQCHSSCGGEARLFYHSSPAGGMEDAVDQTGRAYTQLATAFLYRKKRIDACACKPAPWSEAELARHRRYASEAAATADRIMAASPDQPGPATGSEPVLSPAATAAQRVPLAPAKLAGPIEPYAPGSTLRLPAAPVQRRAYGATSAPLWSGQPRSSHVAPGHVLPRYR